MTVKTASFLITGLDNDELVDAQRANPVSSNSPTQASTPSKQQTFSCNCPVLESLLLLISKTALPCTGLGQSCTESQIPQKGSH